MMSVLTRKSSNNDVLALRSLRDRSVGDERIELSTSRSRTERSADELVSATQFPI